jgi:hypothetical protein
LCIEINRAIRAAEREQDLLFRNFPQEQRPAPRVPPPIDEKLKQLKLENERERTRNFG